MKLLDGSIVNLFATNAGKNTKLGIEKTWLMLDKRDAKQIEFCDYFLKNITPRAASRVNRYTE